MHPNILAVAINANGYPVCCGKVTELVVVKIYCMAIYDTEEELNFI
ncbi:phage tailspike protein [Serratia proteamaculans]